jgi:putative copper export protein/methionine-rich copper-binding protein CopC
MLGQKGRQNHPLLDGTKPLMRNRQSIPGEAVNPDTSPRWRWRRMRSLAAASMLALFLLLLLSGVASAHALLVRSDPAAGAILDYDQAPTQVRLWFTEEINPALTKAVVVDHNNKEVDLQNSHVSPSDPRELDTGLHRLQPGFYVVIWKSVSAVDGHATGGNFLFRVRFPDGTVPSLPSELPTGPANFANSNNGQCLTGSSPFLCVPQVLSDWLVFLMAAIWVGGMFWQAYIVEQAAQRDRALVPTAIATARRFRRIAEIALPLFLLANIGYVMGQSMLAGGSFSSGFSPTIWAGALLHSSFGIFWLLRELLALLALLLLAAFPERPVSEENWHPHLALNWSRLGLGLLLLAAMAFSGHAAAAQERGGIGSFAVPVDWLHLLSTAVWVGGIIFIALVLMPILWQDDEPTRRAEALVKLLPRFSVIALVGVTVAALSGSFNADVQLTSWSQFIDTTYGRTLIIKILLVIVMIMISAYHAFRIRPALARELRAWNQLEDLALPASAGAETNGAAHQQGEAQEARAKAEPLHARNLASAQRRGSTASLSVQPAVEEAAAYSAESDTKQANRVDDRQVNEPLAAEAPSKAGEEMPEGARANGHQRRDARESARVLARIERLSDQIRSWIRREATLGAGVLLCASLLGGFAGSLAPTPPGAPNINAPTLTATTKTPVDMTLKTADGALQVTLKVAPDKFGANSVGLLLVDAKTGKPIDGANVHLIINMVEMDMGTGTADLKSVGGGFYTGQADLLMGGHWTIEVQIRTPQNPDVIQKVTFTIPVTY